MSGTRKRPPEGIQGAAVKVGSGQELGMDHSGTTAVGQDARAVSCRILCCHPVNGR